MRQKIDQNDWYAIQHLTEIIRNQEKKECVIKMTLA